MVISLRIKVQLTAAIIATLLLPLPAEAVPRKVPYCAGVEKEQVIRQVDDFTIICRTLRPDLLVDLLSLYRFDRYGDPETTVQLSVTNFNGEKLVTMLGRQVGVADYIVTMFRLQGRKFDRWEENADPDLLELRRSDVTLLLNTLENFPLKSSPPVRPSF